MELKDLCIICGLKEKPLTNRMCAVCNSLAEEKFYEIPNEFLARKYFKDHLRKNPNTTIAQPALTEDVTDGKGITTQKIVKQQMTASQVLHEQFKDHPATEYIHGIMPSRCPFCKNLSANKGIIQAIKRDTPDYERIVVKAVVPSLVCKACGDFSLYLNHVYSLSREDSIDMLKHLAEIRDKNRKENLVACENCAKALGKKEEYEKNFKITEKEKVEMKKHNRKHLCRECLETIKNGKKS